MEARNEDVNYDVGACNDDEDYDDGHDDKKAGVGENGSRSIGSDVGHDYGNSHGKGERYLMLIEPWRRGPR